MSNNRPTNEELRQSLAALLEVCDGVGGLGPADAKAIDEADQLIRRGRNCSECIHSCKNASHGFVTCDWANGGLGAVPAWMRREGHVVDRDTAARCACYEGL